MHIIPKVRVNLRELMSEFSGFDNAPLFVSCVGRTYEPVHAVWLIGLSGEWKLVLIGGDQPEVPKRSVSDIRKKISELKDEIGILDNRIVEYGGYPHGEYYENLRDNARDKLYILEWVLGE